MKKTNTKKERTEDSKRTIKRAKRGFKLSRCNRRAANRLGVAVGAFYEGQRSEGTIPISAFRMPGKQDKW